MENTPQEPTESGYDRSNDQIYGEELPPELSGIELSPKERPEMLSGDSLWEFLNKNIDVDGLVEKFGAVDQDGNLVLTELGQRTIDGGRSDEDHALNQNTDIAAKVLFEYWNSPNVKNAANARDVLAVGQKFYRDVSLINTVFSLMQSGDTDDARIRQSTALTGGYAWIEGKYLRNIANSFKGKVYGFLGRNRLTRAATVALSGGAVWGASEAVGGLDDAAVDAFESARENPGVATGALAGSVAVVGLGVAIKRSVSGGLEKVEEARHEEGEAVEARRENVAQRLTNGELKKQNEIDGFVREVNSGVLGNIEALRGEISRLQLRYRIKTPGENKIDDEALLESVDRAATLTVEFMNSRYGVESEEALERRFNRVVHYVGKFIDRFVSPDASSAVKAAKNIVKDEVSS